MTQSERHFQCNMRFKNSLLYHEFMYIYEDVNEY